MQNHITFRRGRRRGEFGANLFIKSVALRERCVRCRRDNGGERASEGYHGYANGRGGGAGHFRSRGISAYENTKKINKSGLGKLREKVNIDFRTLTYRSFLAAV